jgi:hypothetical protein
MIVSVFFVVSLLKGLRGWVSHRFGHQIELCENTPTIGCFKFLLLQCAFCLIGKKENVRLFCLEGLRDVMTYIVAGQAVEVKDGQSHEEDDMAEFATHIPR